MNNENTDYNRLTIFDRRCDLLYFKILTYQIIHMCFTHTAHHAIYLQYCLYHNSICLLFNDSRQLFLSLSANKSPNTFDISFLIRFVFLTPSSYTPTRYKSMIWFYLPNWWNFFINKKKCTKIFFYYLRLTFLLYCSHFSLLPSHNNRPP